MSSDNLDTRSRILNSAWKLLESDQGKGVRMADIAKEAGVSRQALYLHFPTRSELLIATTRHLDAVKNIDQRLAASRETMTGTDRLNAFIEAWGNYIPEIYGVAKALLALKDTDEAAALAWEDRMQAVRHGCQAAVQAVNEDDLLSPGLTPKSATDILWAMLSVYQWELLTGQCGWSQKRYVELTKSMARRTLLTERQASTNS